MTTKNVDMLTGIYVLVDQPSRRENIEIARRALAGGADIIQLRGKSLAGGERSRLAADLRRITAAAGRPLIVNDCPDLAIESRADGVHLGPKDASVKDVRAKYGDHIIVGASVGTVEDALAAQATGADYLGVGPVYPTSSKTDARPVLGLPALRNICAAVDIPVFAIGGIDLSRARDVWRTGAAGLAVLSAITLAPDVTSAAAAFKETWRGLMRGAGCSGGEKHVFN